MTLNTTLNIQNHQNFALKTYIKFLAGFYGGFDVCAQRDVKGPMYTNEVQGLIFMEV